MRVVFHTVLLFAIDEAVVFAAALSRCVIDIVGAAMLKVAACDPTQKLLQFWRKFDVIEDFMACLQGVRRW